VKVGIHPDYVDTTITCACGEVVKTRSTRPDIHVEVCSKCHPFFTGKQKLMDTAGRVERFQRKYKRQPRGPDRRVVDHRVLHQDVTGHFAFSACPW